MMREKMIRYLELNKNFDSVFEANTVRKSKAIINIVKVDVVLLDIQLPDASGLDLVQYCQKLPNKPITILCSNYGLPQYLNTYNNLSVDYYFDKSAELSELKTLVKSLGKQRKNVSLPKQRQKHM